jgi:putative ABC transport system substrate-binding protein
VKRRNLILGLLAVTTMSGNAQQSKKVHRIAVAIPAHPADAFTDTSDDQFLKAFFGELNRLGYFEGENLLIERYSGAGRATYSDLVRDVVRRDPDLIIAFNTPLVLDLKAATTIIPIIGIFGLPVEIGIVPNLARPGSNITGVAIDIGSEQWASGSNCCGRSSRI